MGSSPSGYARFAGDRQATRRRSRGRNLRRRRDQRNRRSPAALGSCRGRAQPCARRLSRSGASNETMPKDALPTAHIAYYWGEDAFEIDRAIRTFRTELGEAAGEPMDVWRSPADDVASADSGDEPAGGGAAKRRARVLDEATLRIGTAPLFGAGTLVVIRQPGAITREKAAEQRLVDLVGSVPPGNALAFSDLVASGGKNPSAGERVTEAINEAGG